MRRGYRKSFSNRRKAESLLSDEIDNDAAAGSVLTMATGSGETEATGNVAAAATGSRLAAAAAFFMCGAGPLFDAAVPFPCGAVSFVCDTGYFFVGKGPLLGSGVPFPEGRLLLGPLKGGRGLSFGAAGTEQ